MAKILTGYPPTPTIDTQDAARTATAVASRASLDAVVAAIQAQAPVLAAKQSAAVVAKETERVKEAMTGHARDSQSL